MPPSIWYTAPVMWAARSDARNATRLPTERDHLEGIQPVVVGGVIPEPTGDPGSRHRSAGGYDRAVEEPQDQPFSVTAMELATILAVGVAVAGTGYVVGKARRFVRRIDPTSEFRYRVKDARTAYRDEYEFWTSVHLLASARDSLRRARSAVGMGSQNLGEVRGAMRELGGYVEGLRGKKA